MLVTSIIDPIHFSCLHYYQRLVSMSQTVLVMCIHFFTRLQNAMAVDATYSLPLGLAVSITRKGSLRQLVLDNNYVATIYVASWLLKLVAAT